MTPEGRVKKAVNKALDRFKHYRFMPVPTGYGKKTLDYLVCIGGLFVAIETKAPGKKPTAQQELAIKEITDAGGVVFVIDSEEGTKPLEEFLSEYAARDN